MTLPIVLAIAGCVALLAGLFGGGVKAKEIVVPKMSTLPRVVSSLVGSVLIGTAIWLSSPNTFSAVITTPTPVLPTLTSTSAPSPIPTDTPIPSFTPIPECRFNNLLNCSTSVAFPEENFSLDKLIDGKLFLNFNNQQIGSGLAFRFKPPLNVQGFISLELVSTSMQGVTFLAEYKVKEGDQLKIVTTSEHQSFPATSIAIMFPIPIRYDGEIDEIVINFFEIGEFSELVIDSIRLK